MKTFVIRRLITIFLLIAVLFTSVPLRAVAWAESSSETSNMSPQKVFYSEDWHDYVGDLETFVYGLIVNEINYTHDTFAASVELLDGNSVYGIGYTDYSECYATDDESKYCFEAGFLPFIGELIIPQEDFDEGLLLNNLDYQDPQASFILAFGSQAFTNHCVIYGKYLKYGI